MLALLERCVTDASGSFALCDTDSMAIVATKHGGMIDCADDQVRALSWEQVSEIVSRFAALNPYDHSAVTGSILKIEDVNFEAGAQRQIYAYVISAKRYALFTIDRDKGITIIDDPSEHGLGHLLNPTNPEDDSRDWIREWWKFIVLKELGADADPPDWLERAALSRITASTPEIVKRLNHARKRLPYAEQIKPMNFGLAAHAIPLALPQGIDPEHFQLIAPYENDPRKWSRLPWIDRHSGKRFAITTRPSTQSDVVRVKSYADVLTEYESHPELKSGCLNGENPRRARGLLPRRHVRIAPENVRYIGKESNRIEQVESDLEHCLDDVLEVYREPNVQGLDAPFLEALKKVPSRKLAREAGISERSIRAIRNGHSQPKAEVLDALKRAVNSINNNPLALTLQKGSFPM
jgi:hypothetical protein